MSKKHGRLPMNLPNTITMIRIAMIPFCVILLTGNLGCRIAAALLFAVASFTDHLDGHLARKRNEITDFGKFMDPIADKLLVLMPLIYLIREGSSMDVFAIMMMVAREIVVSGFRLVACSRGCVIAAAGSGKLKTVVQMIAVLMLILNFGNEIWNTIGWAMIWVATVLSVYSGVEILVRNRHILEVNEK